MTQSHTITRPTRGVPHVSLRRTLMILVLSALVTLPALPAPAVSQAASVTAPSVAARLDGYLTGLTTQRQFSGVVFVAQRGAVLLSKGYGLADVAHGVPNTPRTTFPTFSVNATFSAVA